MGCDLPNETPTLKRMRTPMHPEARHRATVKPNARFHGCRESSILPCSDLKGGNRDLKENAVRTDTVCKCSKLKGGFYLSQQRMHQVFGPQAH
jgi:hypothetical protein